MYTVTNLVRMNNCSLRNTEVLMQTFPLSIYGHHEVLQAGCHRNSGSHLNSGNLHDFFIHDLEMMNLNCCLYMISG